MGDNEQMETCDIAIVGTSLVHSILAAALQIAGYKVIHVDENDFYGETNACVSPPFYLRGLEHYLTRITKTDGPSIAQLGSANLYNIELSPRILYAGSRLVQSLRDIGISEYVQFKALSSFNLLDRENVIQVPSSKEAIFTSETMSLMAKRRLMKFVKFAMTYQEDDLYSELKILPLREAMKTKFKIEDDSLTDAICYTLGQASSVRSTTETCLPVIQLHLRSIGLFGPFPAVIAMHGAGSELTQAFCRKAAVKGCTYILNQKIVSSTATSVLLDSGIRIKASHVIQQRPTPQSFGTWRRIVLLSEGCEDLLNGTDGSIIAIPTSSDRVVHCHIYGHGAGVCPRSQSLMFLSLQGLLNEEAEVVMLFDDAQMKLARGNERVITSLQYHEGRSVSSGSYDDILEVARTIFETIAGATTAFLPPETTAEDLEADPM